MFVEGYKKTVSTLKSQGKYELAEGKKYIKESSYTELLKMFAMFCPTSAVPHLKHLFTVGIFCCCFATLMFSTMQRSETVSMFVYL